MCRKEHGDGSVKFSACVLSVQAIHKSHASAAWLTYHTMASLLRTERNLSLSQCDMDYYECMKNKAGGVYE